MNHKFTLGWITSSSPLYSSKNPDWKHHDSLLNTLTSKGVKIHVPVPQTGSTIQMHRLLYEGDKKQLYSTLRDLDILWYDDIKPVDTVADTLDALVLDGVAVFQDITLRDKLLTGHETYEYVKNLIAALLDRGKVVVITDNDNNCVMRFNTDEPNACSSYFELFKDYSNFIVVSPFDQKGLLGIPDDRVFHVPFEVDPLRLNQHLAKPEDRDYLLRYVGNNYYKTETHVDVFEKLGQIGNVLVNGSGWNPEVRSRSPHVQYTIKVSLSPENIINVSNNSILSVGGLSEHYLSDPAKFKDLYLLRLREYLIGGTYFIPDRHLLFLSPDSPFTFEDMKTMTVRDLKDGIREITSDYINTVNRQRESMLDFMRVDRWYPVWCKILRIEEERV